MTRRPAPTPWRQGWTALVLSTLSRVVLGAIALLLAASVLPALIGWQSSVVLSGSMAPTFTAGDVAVVRPVEAASLQPGQVLLVDDPDLPGRLRLHRLVAVTDGALELKGDANPSADGSLVDPSAVHGVVTLGLPLIGRPALWLSEHRVAPLAGTAVALVALLAVAFVHRRPDDDGPPAGPPAPAAGRTGRRPLARSLRRGTVLTAAVLVTVALPGAAARFSDTTASPALTIPVAPWWTCPDVGGPTGANASSFYRLQETGGTTATNTGTAGTAANGTYSGTGITFRSTGPACGTGEDKAIKLDGVAGAVWSTQQVVNPQTFSVQLWFTTTTVRGGKLIGFGNGTNGSLSGIYDRHVYMTNTGQLVFGVYDNATYTVTTPGTYNNGAWHLVTATFSPATGMRLYVDGVLITSGAAPAAEVNTGYWRIGYDNVSTWPSAPTSNYFAGSLAHVSIYPTVLTSTQVAQAWDITR